MEILNIIRILIAIIMFIVVCAAGIYVIIYIKKLNSGLTKMSEKVNDIGNDIKPVLNDISVLTGKINIISDSIVKISNDAENISGKVMDKTEEAEIYIDAVRDAAVIRIRSFMNLLHAVNKGFRVFYKKLN